MSEKPKVQEIQIIYHATKRWPLSELLPIKGSMGNWQQTLSVYNLRDVARLVLSGLGLLNPALGMSEELPP